MTYTNLLIGLLIIGVLASIINLVFIELPRNYNLGFQHGYVCAYYHEQTDYTDYTIYDFEKSDYCEQFSEAFDKLNEKNWGAKQ